MVEQLKEVAEREEATGLIEKIADETICTDVEGLLEYLQGVEHPALELPPMF